MPRKAHPLNKFDTCSDQYTQSLNEAVSFSSDDAYYFAEYKARQLIPLVDPAEPPKILDFCCGIGNIFAALYDHAPDSILHGYGVLQKA